MSTPTEEEVRHAIEHECDAIKQLLVSKNASYGNSALNPVHIFSKADPVTALLVRIDDKVSRLVRGHEYLGDDTVKDLIGYFVLLRVARSFGL